MQGRAVYVKEGLPFARELSLENSEYFYFCFGLALVHSMPYFSFLYQSGGTNGLGEHCYNSSNVKRPYSDG